MPAAAFSASMRMWVEVPGPAEPKASLPGFFLAWATNSAIVLMPSEGALVKPQTRSPTRATGTMSLADA